MPRTTEGALPTDYTFTGQKSGAYIKLIQMGARWYDPETGRFTQPDTIIPDPGNPQSFNRYAYVLNNPVKYTDPTGHSWCDDHACQGDDLVTVSGDNGGVTQGVYGGEQDENLWSGDSLRKGLTQSERIAMLHKTGGRLIKQAFDDLDLLVALTSLDARLTKNNTLAFVDDMTLLTWGWHSRDASYCGFRGPETCESEKRIVPGAALNWPWNGGTGFLRSYQDPPGLESNQIGHFWEYVAASYHDGSVLASVGNYLHEIFGRGNSLEDVFLAGRGIELGRQLSRPLFPMQPSAVPNWIKYNLGQPH